MYHIKNDHSTLCGLKSTKSTKFTSISFQSANQSSLLCCCPECKKQYLAEITKLSKIKINDEN